MSMVDETVLPQNGRAVGVGPLTDAPVKDKPVGRTTFALRALLISDKDVDFSRDQLSERGLDLIKVFFPGQAAVIDRSVLNSAAVVVLSLDSFDPELRRQLINRLKQQHKPVVLLAPPEANACDLLGQGADGVIPSSSSVDALADALWSAYWQYESRAGLVSQVRSLEVQLAEMKIIGQAKSILTRKLQLSDDAALQHLRSEAESRSLSAVELARTLVYVAELGRSIGEAKKTHASNSKGGNRRRRLQSTK
jgi:AmiR/NasT family two-component response regulator